MTKENPKYELVVHIETNYRVFEHVQGHLIEPTERGYGSPSKLFHDFPSIEAFQKMLAEVDPEREQLGLDPQFSLRHFVLLPVIVRSVERRLIKQG